MTMCGWLWEHRIWLHLDGGQERLPREVSLDNLNLGAAMWTMMGWVMGKREGEVYKEH